MSPSVPKGWDRESESLFIHSTGVRIQRMAYKGKDGWYLVPTDLDQPVLEFEPTSEGREKAFEAFAKGALDLKPRKAKAVSKGKAAPPPAESSEDAEEGDEDDEEGKEAGEEADEGDD